MAVFSIDCDVPEQEIGLETFRNGDNGQKRAKNGPVG